MEKYSEKSAAHSCQVYKKAQRRATNSVRWKQLGSRGLVWRCEIENESRLSAPHVVCASESQFFVSTTNKGHNRRRTKAHPRFNLSINHHEMKCRPRSGRWSQTGATQCSHQRRRFTIYTLDAAIASETRTGGSLDGRVNRVHHWRCRETSCLGMSDDSYVFIPFRNAKSVPGVIGPQ